jgi:hypothetical protein
MTRAEPTNLAPPASARRRHAGSRRRAQLRALAAPADAAVALYALGALVPAGAGAAEPAPAPQAPPSASPPAGSTQPAAAGQPQANVNVSLSNDRDTDTWAHPVEVLPIYVHPSVHSREITRTRLFTEDGFPEVYLLLDSRVDSGGHKWIRLRIPGRPNGRIGWVLRQALGGLHVTHWRVRINLSLRRMTVYENDRKRFVAPVGVGKPSTPTPTGHFWIRERFKITNPSSPYYPWAIGTSAYSVLTDWPGGGIVGIHGAFGEPWRIPGDPSHGCVRMLPHDLARIAPLLTLGTPVDIV